MKNLWYLFSAYMVIWGFISIYMFKLNGKISDIKSRMDQLTADE